MKENCVSCATFSGSFLPPGGVIFENSKWLVVLRANPVRFPCLPLLILKRHCEDMADLDEEESSSLGHLMCLTSKALTHAFQPAKVYFGIYAETVKHIHVHVFPRMSNMPPGNIPNLWIGQWMSLLHRLGVKKSYSDEVVAQYAATLRRTYMKFTN